MSCLIGCLALFAPRVAIVLVVIFSDYIGTASTTILWPLLGFIFMPVTTLAYAFAWHLAPTGSVSGVGVVVALRARLIVIE